MIASGPVAAATSAGVLATVNCVETIANHADSIKATAAFASNILENCLSEPRSEQRPVPNSNNTANSMSVSATAATHIATDINPLIFSNPNVNLMNTKNHNLKAAETAGSCVIC